MKQFLRKQCLALEACETTTKRAAPTTSRPVSVKGFLSSADTSVKGTCSLCSEKHYIYQCGKFHGMSIVERRNFVNAKSLCFNCLADGHNNADQNRIAVFAIDDIIPYFIISQINYNNKH